ncbi:regulatory protein RecX [Bacteroidetes/Chlorobi group bacterium Naka2016]|jgi:regulatory protein|nr:MAG: regulatory protein RecX [Bacteroidetes/Chlorobi group bacterium Naka2016]
MSSVVVKSITKKGRRDIFSVEFDNGEKFDLAIDLVAKYKLSKGKKLDTNLLTDILKEQRIIEAKTIALNFVSYKQRTKFEVEQKLKQKHYTESEIQKAIEFLEDFGYLDDKKFAKEYLQFALKQKKYSLLRIKNNLFQKGLSKDLIDEVLRDLQVDSQEFENAMNLALKKFQQLVRMNKDNPVQKVAQYLYSKGFSWGLINKVVEELLGNEEYNS